MNNATRSVVLEMQLVTAIFVLFFLTPSSSAELEAESSNLLCVTVSDAVTNCTQKDAEDASHNSSSPLCSMEMDENNTTNCHIITNISPEENSDLKEAIYGRSNFTTIDSYENTTDPHYVEDLGENKTLRTAAHNGHFLTSNDYNITKIFLPENDTTITREIISMLVTALDLSNTTEKENRNNITTNYSYNLESGNVINSNNTEDNLLHQAVSTDNSTENTKEQSEETTDDNSLWYKLFHWPSSRRKREENQYRTDSEDFQDLDDDGAFGDSADLTDVDFVGSPSEEVISQNSNTTKICDSGECMGNKEVMEDTAKVSNYDITITEIRNEIVILQNEILESDPGETTTAAVWNTNSFLGRMRSLVPENIDARNLNSEKVLSDNSTDETQSVDNEGVLSMDTSLLLNVIKGEISLFFPTNTTGKPDFINFYMEKSPNTGTGEGVNVTAEANFIENVYIVNNIV